MNCGRHHRIAFGLLIGSLGAGVLGVSAVGGFSSSPAGDLAVSSTPWAVDMLLAIGAALMLGWEFLQGRRRRPTRAEQPARADQPAQTSPNSRHWMP